APPGTAPGSRPRAARRETGASPCTRAAAPRSRCSRGSATTAGGVAVLAPGGRHRPGDVLDASLAEHLVAVEEGGAGVLDGVPEGGGRQIVHVPAASHEAAGEGEGGVHVAGGGGEHEYRLAGGHGSLDELT
ncbi:hypothetical protein THAOC_14649, partial [Thalassiosira oceanica]